MDAYKRQRLERHRGDWCLVHRGAHHSYAPTYGTGGCLCGCGYRCPPPKRQLNRIIKRRVQREAEKEIHEAILVLAGTVD